jgi:hypothetical protein
MCQTMDDKAVVFFSNFSINNNYSHFLHALLRLFCALIDAHLIVWNSKTSNFDRPNNITIWLDNNFKITDNKLIWIRAILGSNGILRELGGLQNGQCVSARNIIYGSGCAQLLPPEKWMGYPGCRSGQILPAFSAFMKKEFKSMQQLPPVSSDLSKTLTIAFSVREVSKETGLRAISNLGDIQYLLKRRKRLSYEVKNVTFERLSVAETVATMSQLHIFISVHGAGIFCTHC